MVDDAKKINDPSGGDLCTSDWIKAWNADYIPFHKPTPHADLIKHEEVLLPKTSSVFIPLCGKSVDMKYLSDKGHKVVGLEVSEKGILEFFKDNELSYSRKTHSTLPFDVFQADGADITIYMGDMFEATSQLLGTFDAIWDKSSYVAINANERPKYRGIMATLLKPEGIWLLNCYEYDETKYRATPHSINEVEIMQSFGDQFEVEKLSCCSAHESKFPHDIGEVTTANYSIQLIS